MTKTEMEDAINNCTRELMSVRDILPTLATKADLERFATKIDLERFATKADLERFATKQDLGRFATKDDLHDGIAEAKRHSSVLFESVRDDVRIVAEAVASLTNRLERKGVI